MKGLLKGQVTQKDENVPNCICFCRTKNKIFCRMRVNSFGHHLGTFDFHCFFRVPQKRETQTVWGSKWWQIDHVWVYCPFKMICFILMNDVIYWPQAGHFKVRRSLTLLSVLFWWTVTNLRCVRLITNALHMHTVSSVIPSVLSGLSICARLHYSTGNRSNAVFHNTLNWNSERVRRVILKPDANTPDSGHE